VAELSARDIKLVQYLNEALTKEKQLEQALQAHIAITTLAPYKKRLQQHLSETKNHARSVERRIKQLGGESDGIAAVVQEAAGRVQEVAARGAALAQGPIHMVRGTSQQEVLLKNARTEFKEEAEEIGTYTMIQNLAETVGDRTTADLAKAILREERRMAGFLEKLIPRLTKSVAQAEIPARERNGGRRRTTTRRKPATSRSSTRGSSARGSSKKRAGSSRSASSRSRAATRARGTSRSTSARRTTAKPTTAKRTTAKRSTTRRTTARARS
jgi:ferritin-like metal-binding protein YciE